MRPYLRGGALRPPVTRFDAVDPAEPRKVLRAFAWPAFLLLVVGVSACEEAERPDPPQGVEEPEATAAAMAETTECVNDRDGYMIRYPASWHVNVGDILAPCSIFDPEPFTIPEASEIPLDLAVIIGVESVPFQTLSRDVLGRRDLSRRTTTVDGRDAVRLESETTGEGLYDAGIRFYQVTVDLGDRTFVAAVYEVGPLPLDVKRGLLDRMMATVRFQKPE